MMKRTALLFDLDGTLVDSAGDLRAALNDCLGEFGAPPLSLEAVRGMIGDGARRLVERGLAAHGLPPTLLEERLARFLTIYEAEPARLTRPYPGVPETLAQLRDAGCRLAICTNKPQQASLALLRRLDLERHFTAIVGGDVPARRKPDPDHLLTALAALGAVPREAVMIGDNEHDAAAGKAAGLPVILVRWGYARQPLETLGADRIVDSFAALPAALGALGTA